MTKGATIVVTIAAVIFVFLAVVVGVFSTQNTAISKENSVTEQLDVIATSQNEMFNTLESLVASVKNYENFEGESLKNVIAMRTGGTDAKAISENAKTLERAQIYVNAVHEAYPDLKSAVIVNEYMVAVQRYNSKVAQAYKAYARAKADYRRCTRAWPRRNILDMVGYEVVEFEDLYDGSSVKLPNQGKPSTL